MEGETTNNLNCKHGIIVTKFYVSEILQNSLIKITVTLFKGIFFLGA